MSITLNQLEKYIWEIPKNVNPNMRVPGRIYADRELLGRETEP
jgi:hypothetical protein